MPADADLLCEYFIASNLNSKKNRQNESTNLAKIKSVSDTSLCSSLVSSFVLSESASSTIDFVKYDKSPMDYLKQKYQLLNNGNSQAIKQSQSLNSLNNWPSGRGDKWLELEWCKIRKSGIGLLNLGNNCYLNATLQCLAYTPPLSQWLVSRPHSPTCKFRQLKGFCSLCEVERIIYDIFNSNGFAKPNSLCFNIKKISAVFGIGTQEDASEFFTTLLESMAKSIKFTLNIQNKLSNLQNGKKLNTILDDIFSFQFRSRITCSNCARTSDTIENTNTWPVDVKYVQDIRKGMLHFLREEVLDGENAYKCEKCSKKTRATKKYSIRSAPNILVIQLKRFDFSYAGKLSHFVTYPETLNLKSFMTDEQPSLGLNGSCAQNLNYKLYGVLVHLGYTSHSGHYFSYVLGPNNVWYKADDQRISPVETRDALAQHAYILFYAKLKDSPPQMPTSCISPIEQNIPISCKQEKPCKTKTNMANSNMSEPVVAGLKTGHVGGQKAAEKKKKDYENMTRKQLKKVINNLKKKIKNDTNSRNLKRKLKKAKKSLKTKKDKTKNDKTKSDKTKSDTIKSESQKRKLVQDGIESVISNTSISSLSSTSSTKSFKKMKTEPNGLTLIKQYKSSSSSCSSLSASPSPSPEPILEVVVQKPAIYTYSSSAKTPLSNDKQKEDQNETDKKTSILANLKDSSLSKVKTWNEKILSALNSNTKNEKTDNDEYNQEYDRPRESKLKHNSKKYHSLYSGFHVYTHSNGDYKTNSWNRNKISGFQNYNRSKTFNVFHKR